MDKVMSGPEILRGITVKISPDRKKIKGTGFFISEYEIATCHHVLADKSGFLSESYYVKNDAWEEWMEVKPAIEKCHPPPQDIALLQCPFPLKGYEKSNFFPWDGKTCEFRSRGYDCNTTTEEGASTIDGKDCEIIDYTSRGGESRLQLRTIKRTLLPGRSGSPVWSMRQNAIVGMIDYQAGDENIWTDRSYAIPIESLIPRSRRSVLKKVGQLINVPKLPPNFLPRSQYFNDIKKSLLVSPKNTVAITAVCIPNPLKVGLQGMGGIGKTVLATATARDGEVRRAFPDGLIWLTLGQNPDLVARQSQLAEDLNLEGKTILDIQHGTDILRKLLADRACLIILDDVWKMEHIRAFDVLGSRCAMLITTRDQQLVRESRAKEHQLDILDDIDALKLLIEWSGQRTDEISDAKEVARECGNLPLALAMVGAMVRDDPDGWKSALHKLRQSRLQKIEWQFPDYPYPNLLRAIDASVEPCPLMNGSDIFG